MWLPNGGPGAQPRPVPWLGIKLATLWFQASTQSTEPLSHWTTPARADTIVLYSKCFFRQSPPSFPQVCHFICPSFFLPLGCSLFSNHGLFTLPLMFYIFREREGKDKEMERIVSVLMMGLPLTCSILGTWPGACALTGNWTSYLLVQSPTCAQPIELHSQGRALLRAFVLILSSALECFSFNSH